jgi:hypothetical protein
MWPPAARAALDRISHGVDFRHHPIETALNWGTDPLSRSSLSIDARSVSGATRWRRLLAALAGSILENFGSGRTMELGRSRRTIELGRSRRTIDHVAAAAPARAARFSHWVIAKAWL